MRKALRLIFCLVFIGSLVLSNGDVISNGGFETAGGGGADVFASWTEATAGTSTVNDETGSVHGDSHACRLDVDGDNRAANVSQVITMVANADYILSVWYYNSVADKTAKIVLYNTGTTTWLKSDGTWTSGVPDYIILTNQTGSYTEYTLNFTAPQSTTYAFSLSNNSAASSSIYLDDVSIILAGGHKTILKSGVKVILKSGVKIIMEESTED